MGKIYFGMICNGNDESDYAVKVPRTERFNEIAEELGGFIDALPLKQSDYDRLTELIIKQINEAEHSSYLAGFDTGIKVMKENSV